MKPGSLNSLSESEITIKYGLFMNQPMAWGTERNEILLYIMSPLTSKLEVMYLEVG